MFYLKCEVYVKKKILVGRLLAFGGGNFAVFDDVRFQVLIGVNLEINATDDAAVFAFFIGKASGDRHAFKEFFLNLAIRIAEYCCFHIISILPHDFAKLYIKKRRKEERRGEEEKGRKGDFVLNG